MGSNPIESASDRAAFLSTFGEAATFNSVAITVVFDEDYTELSPSDFKADAATPGCLCLTTDLPNVGNDGTTGKVTEITITSSGTTYNIVSVQDDGTGMTLLMLARQG